MARLELREQQPVKTKVFVSSTSVIAFSHHWLLSYPKKPIRTSIGSWKFFTLRFFVTWIFSVKGNSRGWSMIYHRWRVVHHGTAPFPIHATISKGRTTLFRHFGRMLHLAPLMLHPVDIDSSEGHNSWLL